MQCVNQTLILIVIITKIADIFWLFLLIKVYNFKNTSLAVHDSKSSQDKLSKTYKQEMYHNVTNAPQDENNSRTKARGQGHSMTPHNPKMYLHTKFGIPTPNNIGDNWTGHDFSRTEARRQGDPKT